MKKTFYLLSLAMLAAASGNAKVWRVNNNSGVVADYTDVNTAVNATAVVSGDTIHVEPSVTTYSSVYLSKQLSIIGPGYLLDGTAGGNAGLQANINPAKLNALYFYAGATGSRVIGMTINYYPTVNADSANNITIEKCAIYGFDANNHYSRGIALRKCYINGVIYVSNGGMKDFTVENCLVLSGINTPNLTTGCIIRNCTFDSYYSGITVANCYFANNVVNNNSPGITNAIVKNNLFPTTPTLPAGAVNNIFNTALSSICTQTGSNDAYYQLKTGSPAIGAGVTLLSYTPDCGAFGGPDPYKLSGIPGIPTIYSLTVPASIPTGTSTMSVTISTRNNN